MPRRQHVTLMQGRRAPDAIRLPLCFGRIVPGHHYQSLSFSSLWKTARDMPAGNGFLFPSNWQYDQFKNRFTRTVASLEYSLDAHNQEVQLLIVWTPYSSLRQAPLDIITAAHRRSNLILILSYNVLPRAKNVSNLWKKGKNICKVWEFWTG